jgi:hypothetical protein
VKRNGNKKTKSYSSNTDTYQKTNIVNNKIDIPTHQNERQKDQVQNPESRNSKDLNVENSKNFKPPGTRKTYAEATKQGVCSEDLQQTVQNLMKIVQDLVKRTDDLSEQRTETNGKNRREGNNKFRKVKKQY